MKTKYNFNRQWKKLNSIYCRFLEEVFKENILRASFNIIQSLFFIKMYWNFNFLSLCTVRHHVLIILLNLSFTKSFIFSFLLILFSLNFFDVMKNNFCSQNSSCFFSLNIRLPICLDGVSHICKKTVDKKSYEQLVATGAVAGLTCQNCPLSTFFQAKRIYPDQQRTHGVRLRDTDKLKF